MITGFKTDDGEVYEIAPGGQMRSCGHAPIFTKAPWSHGIFLPLENGRAKSVTQLYDPSRQQATLFYKPKQGPFEAMPHDGDFRPQDRPLDVTAFVMITFPDGTSIRHIDGKGAPALGHSPFQIAYDKLGFGVPHVGTAIVKLFTSDRELELERSHTSSRGRERVREQEIPREEQTIRLPDEDLYDTVMRLRKEQPSRETLGQKFQREAAEREAAHVATLSVDERKEYYLEKERKLQFNRGRSRSRGYGHER